MITDSYGRMGFFQEEIIEALRKNPALDYSNVFIIDYDQYSKAEQDTFIPMPKTNNWDSKDNSVSKEEYIATLQSNWLMPNEYKKLDIEKYLLDKCKNTNEKERVELELNLYKKFNLINLLRYLKYLRDVAKENNIVWGVGRGSSCSSYCLFLPDIHKVDSLYYQLDINEFLRN